MHHCARRGMRRAGAFLARAGASVSATNAAGETPLHLACADQDMIDLTKELLRLGSDPGIEQKILTSYDYLKRIAVDAF